MKRARYAGTRLLIDLSAKAYSVTSPQNKIRFTRGLTAEQDILFTAVQRTVSRIEEYHIGLHQVFTRDGFPAGGAQQISQECGRASLLCTVIDVLETRRHVSHHLSVLLLPHIRKQSTQENRREINEILAHIS